MATYVNGRRGRALTSNEKAYIIQRYQEQAFMSQIAKELGIGKDSVRRCINQYLKTNLIVVSCDA